MVTKLYFDTIIFEKYKNWKQVCVILVSKCTVQWAQVTALAVYWDRRPLHMFFSALPLDLHLSLHPCNHFLHASELGFLLQQYLVL